MRDTDILQKLLGDAKAAYPFTDIAIDDDTVRFCEKFYCEEHEEPHDVASALSIMLQESLELAGLAACDLESDNDSLWGQIVRRIPDSDKDVPH